MPAPAPPPVPIPLRTVREDRFASCRLGNDHVFTGRLAREKRRDAARVVRFLVRREQKGRVAVTGGGGRQQRRRGALDVARAETERALAVDAELERARAPVRRIGHGVEVRPIDERSLLITGTADSTTLAKVSAWCEQNRVLPESLNLGQRNLEDVFLERFGDAG